MSTRNSHSTVAGGAGVYGLVGAVGVQPDAGRVGPDAPSAEPVVPEPSEFVPPEEFDAGRSSDTSGPTIHFPTGSPIGFPPEPFVVGVLVAVGWGVGLGVACAVVAVAVAVAEGV
ncbi:MAG TPA: hypothetical protein VHV31_06105, partial [Nitrolancea sp.]|nr:hypothetical protein [Nitrolancea sp.]